MSAEAETIDWVIASSDFAAFLLPYVTVPSPFPPPHSPSLDEQPCATRYLSAVSRKPNGTRATVADGKAI